MKIEQVGPYRIIGELGRGGMGTVYEGMHEDTGEPAAIKLLSAALAREEGLRERFEAEIETLRKLRHPNIVRLFGFGEQSEQLFYAMELVDGDSLEAELEQGRCFDWREVTQMGIETCLALRHAHDRGVVHRDIKPGNLLLTSDGHIKLSDFGIARLFGNTRITTAGSVIGTAEYMAPEQAEGRPGDPRTDLYSLGAVLYVLLSRRPLFRGKSLPEMLQKQRFEKPEAVRQHAPDCPAELEAIIAQLLEKEPERRIPNAAVLGRRLAAMQEALSVGVNPEPADADAAFDLGPLKAADLRPNKDDLPRGNKLPPTRVIEPPGPPPALPALLAGDDLPETKATNVFRPAEQPPAAPPPKPPGHFTPVAAEELDRHAIEPEHIPFWQVSVTTWVLVCGLVLVGVSVWYFLRAPSADSLYERITPRLDGTRDALLQAEGDIEEFVVRFPQDNRCGQLRQYQREIELDHLQRKFDLHVKGLSAAENLLPIERAYLEAINYVRLDPDRGMAKLQALLDLYGRRADTSGPTGQCLELARRRLVQLHKEIDRTAADHQAMLQDELKEAEQVSHSDPKHAHAIYQAMIELYGDKPWAKETVQQAREALDAQTPR
jgi:eukaryotic-like serine/threonine-protein kinase